MTDEVFAVLTGGEDLEVTGVYSDEHDVSTTAREVTTRQSLVFGYLKKSRRSILLGSVCN